jgi:hypothetical protein
VDVSGFWLSKLIKYHAKRKQKKKKKKKKKAVYFISPSLSFQKSVGHRREALKRETEVPRRVTP